jgi:predicted nucleic acid-binding protein
MNWQMCWDVISLPPLASREISPAFLMQRYGMLAELVKPQVIERTVRDPDDDAVLACALAAQTDLIVSGDSDLLTLQEYEGIRIVNAATVIELIKQQ